MGGGSKIMAMVGSEKTKITRLVLIINNGANPSGGIIKRTVKIVDIKPNADISKVFMTGYAISSLMSRPVIGYKIMSETEIIGEEV